MANEIYNGIPLQFGQTTGQACSVIDTAIMVWEQMGLSTAQIMYGIAMMNLESGDTPIITNGYPTETERGLGRYSNGIGGRLPAWGDPRCSSPRWSSSMA
jgi:hypothetical protein